MHKFKPTSSISSNLTKHSSWRIVRGTIHSRSIATSDNDTKKVDEKSKDNVPAFSESLADKAKQAPKKLTTAELDEQLRQQMAGLSGDGGDSGVEYEDGKPVAMKRSVKNNMFRLI
jgi:hypothetical protein